MPDPGDYMQGLTRRSPAILCTPSCSTKIHHIFAVRSAEQRLRYESGLNTPTGSRAVEVFEVKININISAGNSWIIFRINSSEPE
ncbi:hypothetical protein GJAV_G00166600 [Gymnothorax javanicus]|nr:hypothetical protein GJAV_G00166600 [Gymnothorax javanicus]